MIREALQTDIKQIAAIHSNALPNDLLPQLGINFLSHYFIPTCLRSKNCFILVNGNIKKGISAFVIFAYDTNKLTREVTAYKIPLLIATLKAIIKKPRFIKETLAFIRNQKQLINIKDLDISALPELYIIATDSSHQRQGHGSKLLNIGLDMLQSQGHKGCIVKTALAAATQFYLKHDFKPIGIEYRGTKKFNILLRDFISA